MPGWKRQGSMAKNRRPKKRSRKERALVPLRNIAYGGGKVISTYSPLPKKLHCRLRYMEKDIAVNPTVGGLASDYVFRITSLFDINLSGTGHQPVGFDQIMPFYKYYVVSKVNAHVIFQNTDASNEALCAVHLNNTSTSITDIRVAVENGRTVYQMLGKTGSSRDISNLVISCDVAKEFGVKDLTDDVIYRGTSTTDPSANLFMHCIGQPNSTNDSGVIGLTVIFELDVYFLEPQNATLS